MLSTTLGGFSFVMVFRFTRGACRDLGELLEESSNISNLIRSVTVAGYLTLCDSIYYVVCLIHITSFWCLSVSSFWFLSFSLDILTFIVFIG